MRRERAQIREVNLARLLNRRPDGIFLSDFEREIGLDLFQGLRIWFGRSCLQGSRIVAAVRSTGSRSRTGSTMPGRSKPTAAKMLVETSLLKQHAL